MINEAHNVPQHRLTTLLLLASLKREGYGYFAAETLDERDKDLQTLRVVTIIDSGLIKIIDSLASNQQAA
jgi:hypothetical protein